jgi:hypothetical protein
VATGDGLIGLEASAAKVGPGDDATDGEAATVIPPAGVGVSRPVPAPAFIDAPTATARITAAIRTVARSR